MDFLKNIKFVRKIQLGFFILGSISALIAFSDIYQISKMSSTKSDLFTEFFNPKEHVDQISNEFQKIQFIMLKFSIAEFSDDFKNNINAYNFHKDKIDYLLDSLSQISFNEDIFTKLSNIKGIWEEYKFLVADAIISASASHTYDMAAVIATTSGEEVGSKITSEINDIVSHLEIKSEELNAEFNKAENDSLIFLISGMIIGTVFLFLSVFLLAPMISKPINKLLAILKQFTLGNFDLETKADSKDEFGELVQMADTFKKAQIEKIVAAQSIADGSLAKVPEASNKDTLAQAFNKEVSILEDLLREIDKLLIANEKGDLSLKIGYFKIFWCMGSYSRWVK